VPTRASVGLHVCLRHAHLQSEDIFGMLLHEDVCCIL